MKQGVNNILRLLMKQAGRELDHHLSRPASGNKITSSSPRTSQIPEVRMGCKGYTNIFWMVVY